MTKRRKLPSGDVGLLFKLSIHLFLVVKNIKSKEFTLI